MVKLVICHLGFLAALLHLKYQKYAQVNCNQIFPREFSFPLFQLSMETTFVYFISAGRNLLKIDFDSQFHLLQDQSLPFKKDKTTIAWYRILHDQISFWKHEFLKHKETLEVACIHRSPKEYILVVF